MKNDDKKNKKAFEEKILDQFPEDLLPGFDPSEIDVLNSSFGEMLEASGIRKVIDRMVQDPEQRKYTQVFLDGLIQKNSEHFEAIREKFKDDSLRRKLLKEIALRSKHVK